MHKNCPKCDLRYEREPGFFFGAMYISYAFSVATFIACGLATYVIGNNPEAWVYVAVVIVATLLTFPISYRYSRILMLHFFGGVTYKPRFKEKVSAHND